MATVGEVNGLRFEITWFAGRCQDTCMYRGPGEGTDAAADASRKLTNFEKICVIIFPRTNLQ